MLARTLSVILTVVSLAGCAHGVAPLAGGAAAPAEPLPSPFAALGERESLQLSSAQVAAIDSIAREWAAREVRLRALPTAPILPRGVVRLVHDGLRRNHEARARNDRRALQAVGELLTAEQRAALCRSAAGAPDSVERARPARWPWCAPDPRASSLARLSPEERPDRDS